MEISLLEYLLNEGESTSLDFKRDQYSFYGATDEDKGELLKDILAFANAWRRTDAYILIGVDEIKGGGDRVVGITSHLADSDLQQFVNSKTNKPLTFSYEAVTYNATQMGVIRITAKERPFYLKNKFGKLDSDKVYIRRGSSTTTASLDEVTKMMSLVLRDNNTQAELRALVSELEYFINTKVDDWYVKSKPFLSDQYQRVFSLGILASLDEELRNTLQECYAEIRNVDRLCLAGWGGSEMSRSSSLNEARSRFFEALPKAKKVRDALNLYLETS